MIVFRKQKRFTVQLYYPTIKLSRAGLEVQGDTRLWLKRVMVGIQVAGFGIGVVF